MLQMQTNHITRQHLAWSTRRLPVAISELVVWAARAGTRTKIRRSATQGGPARL